MYYIVLRIIIFSKSQKKNLALEILQKCAVLFRQLFGLTLSHSGSKLMSLLTCTILLCSYVCTELNEETTSCPHDIRTKF